MATEHKVIRAAAIGLATVALTASASVTAQAAQTAEQSGHLTCAADEQVRVWSNAWGDKVTTYWASDNDDYGSDVRTIDSYAGPVTTQTFTLHRNVWWRVVAKGSRRAAVTAGARCYAA